MNSFKDRFSTLRKLHISNMVIHNDEKKTKHSHSCLSTESTHEDTKTIHSQNKHSHTDTIVPTEHTVTEKNKQLPIMRAMVCLNTTFAKESHDNSLCFEQTRIALQHVQYYINMLNSKTH